MQGRLSPIRNGRIQSFPWETWEKEIESASAINFNLMEWTIDSEKFEKNPLFSEVDTGRITELIKSHDVRIQSVTCDYYMENPFGTSDDSKILTSLKKIIQSMQLIKANILIIPLVDNSSMPRIDQATVDLFLELTECLEEHRVKIAFESDFNPLLLAEFIQLFSECLFGINYDIGNSAALGFKPSDEFAAYGGRVINVHVKDRPLGGSTVPLGQGDVDFSEVFRLLEQSKYQGNYILQTARAEDGSHADTLSKYREMVVNWVLEAENRN
jgi:hexulose-6-phosphate isomerase